MSMNHVQFNYTGENAENGAKKVREAFIDGNDDSIEMTKDEYMSFYTKMNQLSDRSGYVQGLRDGAIVCGITAFIHWLMRKRLGKTWKL